MNLGVATAAPHGGTIHLVNMQASSELTSSWFASVLHAISELGWIDITALTVMATFFLIGLFQGLIWQVSRIAILIIAYGLASNFAQGLSDLFVRWTINAPDGPSSDHRETAYYVACVVIFLLTLIVLSLLSMFLQHLVRKSGMSFFDRLGGGVVGVATGGVLMLVFLTAVFMFMPESKVAHAAESSQSFQVSRWAVHRLGGLVPAELTRVFPSAATPAADPAATTASEQPPPGGH
ncbi:MAG: CvpA family protein [Planctomycetes bacterium]|nr:CvpA family protein [Planctomycetota bacterium]